METPLTVHSLHALAYCERLFFLEEVERIRIADERVYAGRTLHVEIEREEDDEILNVLMESNSLGLIGKVDCIRKRDGKIIPYEHKRGRSAKSKDSLPAAWDSDRLQVIAYSLLAEEHFGQTIPEGRIRYHADNVMVRVPVDEEARKDFRIHLARARTLQQSLDRPPVSVNERLCAKCSLAPVCLPEEARLVDRLVRDENGKSSNKETDTVLQLFPPIEDRQVLHVLTNGAKVGKKGEQLEIWSPETGDKESYPTQEIAQVVIHGFAQISTQALRLCSDKNLGVHWISYGGKYMGSWSSGLGSVQRRIRQYAALSNELFKFALAKRLVEAKVRSQLSFLLRASREQGRDVESVSDAIAGIRKLMSPLRRAKDIDSLRGFEGKAGAFYFGALPHLISLESTSLMRPEGRNRRPPKDRCNAMLSFGYALLLKDITNAILTVGLDPCLGFFHTPRSQAQPLSLDLLEIFRVSLVDLPAIGSINRRQWDESEDFSIAGEQVWLSDSGRKKFIEIYEKRKSAQWKHPVIGYSLSYARHLELEVRLLEKEWTDNLASTEVLVDPKGLFARTRLR